MKIGLLTLHRCINYGSYWQTRCLQEGLAAFGHDVVVLDHQDPRVDRAEWRCALRPTQPARGAPGDARRYAHKCRRFHGALAELPLSAPFALDKGPPAGLDAVVVGSDEVWNLQHPWYAGRPLFFGEPRRAPRYLAYAASFGHWPATGAALPARYAQWLQKIEYISVRDPSSARIVAAATGRAPALVLDPCLQFTQSTAFAQASSQAPEGEPYIAVYGHNFTPHFVDALRHCARRRGARLLSLGYRNDWADDQWLEAGPRDFLHAMAGARGVATNFFHGCVFALRFGRPLACEMTPYRSVKLQGLVQMLEIDAHLLQPFVGGRPPDPLRAPGQRTCALLDVLRMRSSRFLAAGLDHGA
jgi:hypothetical protein